MKRQRRRAICTFSKNIVEERITVNRSELEY